jgi:excisionase family DNA binding protein
MKNDLIGYAEIGKELGITRQAVSRMHHDGKLPAKEVMVGSRCFFKRSELDGFIKRYLEGDPEKPPFEYGGWKLRIILFCQPALLNRMSY